MPERSKMPDLFGRATATFGEHAHLREVAARLQTLCDASGDARDAAERELRSRLRDFRAELATHFEAEDSDGYFGMLEQEAPRLAVTVARLRTEHARMLSELDAISAMSEGEFEALRVRVASLLSLFRAHERTESRLMHDFFERDEKEVS